MLKRPAAAEPMAPSPHDAVPTSVVKGKADTADKHAKGKASKKKKHSKVKAAKKKKTTDGKKHKKGKKDSRPAPDGRPRPTTDPTEYNGGKIYYSQAHGKLRFYIRKGDRIEKSRYADPTDRDEFKEVWKWGLDLIDADPRPRNV